MRRRVVRFGATLLLAWAAPTVSAHAACGTPDVVDTLPPDGQALVPTNTPLSAIYELGATHQGEPVMVTAAPGSSHQLAASYSRVLRSLVVTLPNCDSGPAPGCVENPDFPGGQLKPNTQYTVEWPGLSSDAATRAGRGTTVTFTSGPGPDASSPSFDGTREVRWDFEREFDSCSDTESERYIFDVRVSPPSYAGGEELLVLHVFQTVGRLLRKDENGNAVPEEVHRGRYRGGEWIRVEQPIATGVGKVCFSAFAEAPNGLISQGSETEACTRTEHPPFFEGCSFGARHSRSQAWALWLAVVGGALFVRARSASTKRASPHS
ncbi:MAG TPA: Ig-like domain-containing protein [Polyangiaceae bacterium]|nr:Ig-like domain-containing protein [Polyangiaceae bacterium]